VVLDHIFKCWQEKTVIINENGRLGSATKIKRERNKMKVALVIWTNPDYYQAVIYTAQILSERGHKVDILCQNTKEDFFGNVDYGSSIRVWRVGSRNKGFRNYIAFLKFLFFTMYKNIRMKYDLIIGYDMFGFAAAFLMTRIKNPPALIYHNFDLSDMKYLNFFGRQVKRLEYAGACKANAVVFSSEGRAQIFKEEARLLHEPLIIMNCQRISPNYRKTDELQKILGKKGIKADKVVIRLGSIGPGHAIEATVRSVEYWQDNWALVFLGVPLGNYITLMQKLVSDLGLTRRVSFIPYASYDLWNSYLYNADLGLALYEPVNINHQTMAGAGQKMLFYLKAGIPSILPALPDFIGMVNKYRFGVVANPNEPQSIAEAVNNVLGDERQYNDLAQAAKEAFFSEFNFEKQFSPILKLIDEVCMPDG